MGEHRRQLQPEWIAVWMSTWGLQLISLKRTVLWGGQGSTFMPIESADHLLTADPGSMWLDWGYRWGGSVEKFCDMSSAWALRNTDNCLGSIHVSFFSSLG